MQGICCDITHSARPAQQLQHRSGWAAGEARQAVPGAGLAPDLQPSPLMELPLVEAYSSHCYCSAEGLLMIWRAGLCAIFTAFLQR